MIAYNKLLNIVLSLKVRRTLEKCTEKYNELSDITKLFQCHIRYNEVLPTGANSCVNDVKQPRKLVICVTRRERLIQKYLVAYKIFSQLHVPNGILNTTKLIYVFISNISLYPPTSC